MRMRWIAAILVVSVGGMQASAATMAAARQARMAQRATLRQTAVAAQSAVGAGPTAAAGTIDVPVGTKVQLNLVSPVMSLSTKAGDTVRAVVAFPVTVGNQVAIPAGTFVEGQFVSARAAGTKPKKGTSGPALQIHFTKLVYANGYTVALDAQESAAGVSADAAEVASADEERMPIGALEHGPDGGAAFLEGQFGSPFPTPPPLPPLPNQHPGPNPVAITLGAVGAFALITVGVLLLAKRGAKPVDVVLYDAGFQFSMLLTSPLRLDGAQVMDAARMAPAS
jgi:type IV secretion system protein VirB10